MNPITSSTTSHIFNKALGQLHGSWCKQPLRVNLDYDEEVHQSRIYREREQYDWLWNGFFIIRGLHRGQDSSGGELKAWMKKRTWLPTLFARGVLWRSSFLGNLQPSNDKIGVPRSSNSRHFFSSFPSWPPSTIPIVESITLSWVEILD